MAAQGARRLSTARRSVVLVGTFDGVHLGHQHLLRGARARAEQVGARVLALTCDPPPRTVLRPDSEYRLLSPLDERVELLRAHGADDVDLLRFDRALADTTAEEFVRGLVERHAMVEIVGGPDLALGRGRQGTPERLREIGKELGFGVTLVPPLIVDGRPVRSGEIRELLANGHVREAARLLGRRPTLSGEVVHGDHRGRTIGFPTANLAVPPERLIPGNGVYAVYARIGGESRPAVMNVGTRPTVDGTRRTVEAHLLDFDGELYGRQLTVELVARLRDERKFGSLDELMAQIRLDAEEARRKL